MNTYIESGLTTSVIIIIIILLRKALERHYLIELILLANLTKQKHHILAPMTFKFYRDQIQK